MNDNSVKDAIDTPAIVNGITYYKICMIEIFLYFEKAEKHCCEVCGKATHTFTNTRWNICGVYLPITTGINDSQRDKGICCPRMNWDADALKNGSKAEMEEINQYE